MPSARVLSSAKRRRAGAPPRGVLALLACGVALAGCGAVRVQPNTPAGATHLASRGQVDSPLTDMDNHLGCIRSAHVPVQVVSPIKLQVGTAPTGPVVVFTSTPGAAQDYQIEGKAQGAEVIGTALLYPNQGPDPEVAAIEACLDQGVQG
jgi:hypothetical protein